MTTEENSAKIWDVTKSHSLAFLSYYPALVDKASLMGVESSLDGNGVAYEVMSAADYLAYFGVAPQPRQPVGPAAGAGAAVLANWNADTVSYKDQIKCKAQIRKFVLDTVPQELLIPMQDGNRSIRLVD